MNWRIGSRRNESCAKSSKGASIGQLLVHGCGGEIAQTQLACSVVLLTISPEIMEGHLDARGEIQQPVVTTMLPQDRDGSGSVLFRAALHSSRSGLRGYAIRLLAESSGSGHAIYSRPDRLGGGILRKRSRTRIALIFPDSLPSRARCLLFLA